MGVQRGGRAIKEGGRDLGVRVGQEIPGGDCGAVAALRGGGGDRADSGPCWSAAGATRSRADRSVRAEARAGRWAAGKGGPSGSGLLGQKGRGRALGRTTGLLAREGKGAGRGAGLE